MDKVVGPRAVVRRPRFIRGLQSSARYACFYSHRHFFTLTFAAESIAVVISVISNVRISQGRRFYAIVVTRRRIRWRTRYFRIFVQTGEKIRSSMKSDSSVSTT